MFMCLLNFEFSEHSQVTKEEVLTLLLSHKEKLQRVANAFLLRVVNSKGEDFVFLITPSEITTGDLRSESGEIPEISVDLHTLQKVLENPHRALRFYFQGKIKIKGDPKDLFIL